MEEHKLHNRRLTDKIILCVHAACDQDNTSVAMELLIILDNFIKNHTYSDVEKRKIAYSTVAAHERIWALRHEEEQKTF